MEEIRKQNVVKGYTLSRLAPLDSDDEENFEKNFNKLSYMLQNIDPSLQLIRSEDKEKASIESMKQFYFKQYGVPGTPEFIKKLETINNE